MSKLKSRKFWLACSAVLGSVAAAIAGFATENEFIATVGIICGVLSAAIYEIVEAVCDVEGMETDIIIDEDEERESEG